MKEKISLKHIKPNPANPRIIRDGKFADLKRSIAQFPQMLEARGIAVMLEGGKYVALGGNQRYRALVDLQTEIDLPDFESKYKCTSDSFFKLKSYFDSGIPIEDCTAWTDEQKRRFIIADNLPFGEWDTDALANEWDVDELKEWGFDLDALCFSGAPNDAGIDDVEADDVDTIETDIQRGDLFEIGPHRLLCGDSTQVGDVDNLMRGEKADIVFTDPPHDLDIDTHDEILNICLLFSKYDVFILSSNKALISLAYRNSNFNDFFVHDFVFHIGSGSGPLRQYDLIAHFNKCRFFNNNEGFSNCVRVNSMRMGGYASEKLHNHQKSVDLIDKFIRHYSEKNDCIFDPFLGSGTTMVAAHQIDRKCYGIEIDPKYCQVVVNRMLKLYPNIEIRKNGDTYIIP